MRNTALSLEQSVHTIGARVTARRNSLGLSLDLLAARAGMSTSYLDYVESRRGQPSMGVMRRLAEALHTTPEHLYGDPVLEPALHFSRHDSRAAGPTSPKVVSRLTTPECLLLLGSVPVGRVAFVINGPPVVLPVNFTLRGRSVVIQTAAMSPLAETARANRTVSFEADDIDEESQSGWSVLCQGPCRIVLEEDEREGDHNDLVHPWVGDDRRTIVGISPIEVTGRRIGRA
jgi:transcriptional regulator with XRE-family HTH domain